MKKRFICYFLSLTFVLYLFFGLADTVFATSTHYRLCGKKENISEICLEFMEKPNMMDFREVVMMLDNILSEREKNSQKTPKSK